MPYIPLVLLLVIALTGNVSAQETALQRGDAYFAHDEYQDAYKDLLVEVNTDLQPGDKGYRTNEFDPLYQELYSSGKCNCKHGYCRPTDVRSTILGAKSGYDVVVNRHWFPVPLDALQHERTLSKELMRKLMKKGVRAHVCAYDDPTVPGGQRIECVVLYLSG
ncbi:MAG TPA: hypothetical protein VJH21_00230 [Candidatus Paceibacterota bacterium]